MLARVLAHERPRVALFANRFLPYSQTFVFDELRHHRRWDAEVFCIERENADRFPFEPVHALAPARGLGEQLEVAAFRTIGESRRFAAILGSGRFSLLHAHFGTAGVRALPARRLTGLPLVVTFHGYDVPVLLGPRRFSPKFWSYWARARRMLREVDRFLAASDELARLLRELGAPAERVRVWRLGIELPERTEPKVRPVRRVIMVGRFVEKKGFVDGIEAFCRVARDHPELRLEIVGEGELRPRYDAVVASHGAGDRVEFAGVLPHAQVLARIGASDVLLAPSVVASHGDRESGLIVVKEAAARSVPAIGTLHGGIPEIIDDGQTGFLVPERDPSSLEDRLRRLVADPALRARLGGAARAKMEREYDIRDRVQALEEHYDEVVAEHGRRA
jgi:colanic acid/amylovoran biosynthesis glycosyltransferase